MFLWGIFLFLCLWRPVHLFEVVQEALTNEATDKLALVNLVTFYKTEKDASVKRNPATGEPVDVPAYTRLTAKPVKSLKDSVR